MLLSRSEARSSPEGASASGALTLVGSYLALVESSLLFKLEERIAV